ncbi:MAG: trypsin-like peptidase domain-containing protein [Myxococcota bacterium]|nr:trypsin-like peptidase domain-containing protein [Myxococcota bacterium]
MPGVVALRVSATRPFDTETSGSSKATGFVVDAEQGLILTNRHVVQPGPVVTEAVFLNHERVAVRPVYRDPVHDFGFYRYDPADVRFMHPVELELRPDAARVGAQVRVIGNDAGEKLSILDGTLARLDRAAPRYGRGRFNDFNTFYLQAASSSSGGSSGSPVIDRLGRVVGLNAGGGRRSASSFFLPLERVVRAFELIRRGQPVPRGTLQTIFTHRPYDELRRLGLREKSEAVARHRFAGGTGLLVVSERVPGGAGDGVLEPGDILLSLAGEPLADFASLEAILDDSVGETLAIEVERGGEPLELSARVEDLHAITPAAYVETGGAVVHSLSYQQARSYAVPAGGVYLASRGYVFSRANVPPRSVITHVDGEPVPDLEAFEQAFASRADGARVRLRYFPLRAPRSPGVAVARIDRRWYPMQRCDRNDATGLWDCRPSAEPPPAEPPKPSSARLEFAGPRPVKRVAPSLALVSFDVPYRVDGVQGGSFLGAGLVVDADRGLVVVDRDTVPVPIGDVTVTFGGAIEVPGEVVAFHPDHNLALVRYEPALIGDTPVESARLRDEPLVPGQPLWLVALTDGSRLVTRRTAVSQVDAPVIPIPRVPRFREQNVELVSLTETANSVGGALTDDKGRVLAFWASFSRDQGGKPGAFFAGLPAGIVSEWIEPFRSAGENHAWRSLGAELSLLSLAEARARGLPEADAARLEEHDPQRRQVLSVRQITADAPARRSLRVGDLVLAVNGAPVTRFREMERAAQRGDGSLDVTLLREGERVDVVLESHVPDTEGLKRVVAFGGALLQQPPRELAAQRGLERAGVYVSGRWAGSPADRSRLPATQRIRAVDGRETPDLDAFLAAVSDVADRDSVRLHTEDLEGRRNVLTLEPDLHYWPTVELRLGEEGWQRTHH